MQATGRPVNSGYAVVPVGYLQSLIHHKNQSNMPLKTPSSLEDCHYFYNSTCTKGTDCKFRHCTNALGCEQQCKNWKHGHCKTKDCPFRHIRSKDERSKTSCFHETQPQGCLKLHCPFKHVIPRDQKYYDQMITQHKDKVILPMGSTKPKPAKQAATLTPADYMRNALLQLDLAKQPPTKPKEEAVTSAPPKTLSESKEILLQTYAKLSEGTSLCGTYSPSLCGAYTPQLNNISTPSSVRPKVVPVTGLAGFPAINTRKKRSKSQGRKANQNLTIAPEPVPTLTKSKYHSNSDLFSIEEHGCNPNQGNNKSNKKKSSKDFIKESAKAYRNG